MEAAIHKLVGFCPLLPQPGEKDKAEHMLAHTHTRLFNLGANFVWRVDPLATNILVFQILRVMPNENIQLCNVISFSWNLGRKVQLLRC